MSTPDETGSDETDLICRVQAGEVEAFAVLAALHAPRLRTFIGLRAPAPHLADDLTQDTLVFAYRRIQEFIPGTAFGAWLRAIAHQLLRAEVQRFSRERANRARLAEQLLIDRSAVLDGGREHLDDEMLALEECLPQLDDWQRELLQMRYQEGLGSMAIANRLDRSPEWVRTSLFRIRNRLREAIQRRLAARTTR